MSTKTELDQRLQALQGELAELKQSPEWSTNRPYMAMLDATVRYVDTGMRDAIWIWAQMYVDLAATGAWSAGNAGRHTEIPAEFGDLFDGLYSQVAQAQSVEEVYHAMSATMWDAITIGPFMRPKVSFSAITATFHLRANDTLLREGAAAIWEVLEASRRLGPVSLALAASLAAGGQDGPPPESAQQLVFYTFDESGRERPPIWVQVHVALVGAHVAESIATRAAQEWASSWDEAAGGPVVRQLGSAVGRALEVAGGVGGVVLLAGGVALAVWAVPKLLR